MNQNTDTGMHCVMPESESRIQSLFHAAREDLENGSLRTRSILIAAIGGLSFDWGVGNEAMLGYVASNVHKLTENPVLTGLSSGASSFVEQGIIGGLVALSVHELPKFSEGMKELVKNTNPNLQDRNLGRFGRSMILGAGVDLTFAVATDTEGKLDSKRGKIRRVLGSAAIIGSANSVILTGMSGLLWAGDKYGFETFSEGVVDIASNPLTYAGVFGGVYGFNKAKKLLSKRFNSKNDNKDNKLEFDLIPQELMKTQDDLVISVSNKVEASEYETLWDMVQSGFMELNRKSYEKQDMTREELVDDLDSAAVLKYVARDKEGALVGLLTVHLGLEGIDWTNTDSLVEYQRSIDPDARAYYVGTIVVPVDKRGTSVAADLIKSSLVHFQMRRQEVTDDSQVFFDCAGANYPWLGEFIQSQGKPSTAFPHLNVKVNELYMDAWVNEDGIVRKIHKYTGDTRDKQVIDTQHYYAISTSAVSDAAPRTC